MTFIICLYIPQLLFKDDTLYICLNHDYYTHSVPNFQYNCYINFGQNIALKLRQKGYLFIVTCKDVRIGSVITPKLQDQSISLICWGFSSVILAHMTYLRKRIIYLLLNNCCGPNLSLACYHGTC